ncbi:MAG: hypothetical protein L0Z62_13225 [Gemmataceae bacterium]|nr:hypothetical protein [Gemmataceae bacterium]
MQAPATRCSRTTTPANNPEPQPAEWIVRLFGKGTPLGFQAGDENLYRYVHNNSINFTDSSGLVPHPRSIAHDVNAICSRCWDQFVLDSGALNGQPGPQPVRGSRAFDGYFERAVIRLLGLQPYRRPPIGAPGTRFDSRERERQPNGRLPVRPDAVSTIRHVPFGTVGAGRPPVTFENSFFIDAKRGNLTINPSSYYYEGVGYADVLGRSPAAASTIAGVRPMMLYVTTTDIVLSQELVDLFTARRVVVAQAYMARVPGTYRFYLTEPIILNPEVRGAPRGLGAATRPVQLDWNLIRPFN